MRISRHYLISSNPPKTNIHWNSGVPLSAELRAELEKIASWDATIKEDLFFREFAASGRRSYICALRCGLQTPLGIHSAIKFKAIGNTNPFSPHLPMKERYNIDPNIVKIEADGEISIESVYHQPHFGATFDRMRQENFFTKLANDKKVPAPFALGVGQYPDLFFEEQTLGFTIMAVKDLETEKRRLGRIFQVKIDSAKDYLRKVAKAFFGDGAGHKDLKELFVEAGRTQREFNDNSLIPDDCHVGNFAVNEDAKAILNDFETGKSKEGLSKQQVSIYQFLDLNRFIYSVFLLRAWPSGDLLMNEVYPISAFLEGYFGKEVFSRHKGIGTPESLVVSLKRPKEDPEKNRFIGSMKIMHYCWKNLYDPLQEILAEEGNGYFLDEQEKLMNLAKMYRPT